MLIYELGDFRRLSGDKLLLDPYIFDVYSLPRISVGMAWVAGNIYKQLRNEYTLKRTGVWTSKDGVTGDAMFIKEIGEARVTGVFGEVAYSGVFQQFENQKYLEECVEKMKKHAKMTKKGKDVECEEISIMFELSGENQSVGGIRLTPLANFAFQKDLLLNNSEGRMTIEKPLSYNPSLSRPVPKEPFDDLWLAAYTDLSATRACIPFIRQLAGLAEHEYQVVNADIFYATQWTANSRFEPMTAVEKGGIVELVPTKSINAKNRIFEAHTETADLPTFLAEHRTTPYTSLGPVIYVSVNSQGSSKGVLCRPSRTGKKLSEVFESLGG